jgi:hypothetical protein
MPMKIRPEFDWRALLAAGRWQKQDAGCYRRGKQRIVRHPVRSKWLYYPDVRSDRAFVFHRLASALRNARRP